MPTQRLLLHGFRPATTNVLLRLHWAARNRRLKADAGVVALESLAQGLTKARGRRRVSLVVLHKKGRSRPDADNCLKSLLDAMTACGLILDDGPDWLELGTPTYQVADKAGLEVILEDVEP